MSELDDPLEPEFRERINKALELNRANEKIAIACNDKLYFDAGKTIIELEAEVVRLEARVAELEKWTDLPNVGGRRIDMSNNEFEHRCRSRIGHEQRNLVNPDSALVGLLCDAVRMVREYNDVMTQYVQQPPSVIEDSGGEG